MHPGSLLDVLGLQPQTTMALALEQFMVPLGGRQRPCCQENETQRVIDYVCWSEMVQRAGEF